MLYVQCFIGIKIFFTKVLDFFFFKTKFTYVVLAVLEPLCRTDWP